MRSSSFRGRTRDPLADAGLALSHQRDRKTIGSNDGVKDQAGDAFRKPSVDDAGVARRAGGRRGVAVAFVGMFTFYYSSTKALWIRGSSSRCLPRRRRSTLRRARCGRDRSSASRLIERNCARRATRPMEPRRHRRWAPIARTGRSITVHPGPQSYHAEDSATIRISGDKVQSITDDHGQELASYELEPLLITGPERR